MTRNWRAIKHLSINTSILWLFFNTNLKYSVTRQMFINSGTSGRYLLSLFFYVQLGTKSKTEDIWLKKVSDWLIKASFKQKELKNPNLRHLQYSSWQFVLFATALVDEGIEGEICHSVLTWPTAKLSPDWRQPFKTCSGGHHKKYYFN